MTIVKYQKMHPDVILPKRQSSGAAGYDVYAFLRQETIISKREILAIPTGLQVEIPSTHLISVRPRSGLAIKHGITCINSPGTIDSDFRGEIKILLINLGSKDYALKPNERIAQFLLEKVYTIDWQEDQLRGTNRGEGGFGSTGRE